MRHNFYTCNRCGGRFSATTMSVHACDLADDDEIEEPRDREAMHDELDQQDQPGETT